MASWIAAIALATAESPPQALWIALGFIGAVFSGMFGIGVVLTVPLLLYLPPLLGREAPGIHAVTAVTTVQVAVVGLAGALSHVRDRLIKWSLIPVVGATMAPGALLGAALSRYVSGRVLSSVFAALVVSAAVALMSGRGSLGGQGTAADVKGNRALAAALGGGLGFLVGMVGLGGGFLLVPLLTYVLHVPLRVAVGTSLGVLAFTGLAGMIGKAVTGQVDWLFAAALVAGALPGVRVGTWIGRRIHIRYLAFVLGAVLGLVAAKMWWDILRGWDG